MNARNLRRLAADHHMLHTQPLPPNYLFPTGSSAHNSDDLTSLDVLLVGPAHTPFASGLWRLHLAIPSSYPQTPPTAHFRTPIFHPNVDPTTGAVCVETLKRDWDAQLTLRDVLVTICCLLIQPNPDSALNADAGALIQEDYAAFARRAEMLAGIQAGIPRALVDAVREAQERGNENAEGEGQEDDEVPVRRRRTIANVRAKAKKDQSSPARGLDAPPRRRPAEDRPATTRQPFVLQTADDDVFGFGERHHQPPSATTKTSEEEDNSMTDADQENDASLSPMKISTPKTTLTPRRPHGVHVPLGELILEEESEEYDEEIDTSEDMELEYPPSPRKSPSKSAGKSRQAPRLDAVNFQRPEGSRNAALRAPNMTPPNDIDKPLAESSPFAFSASASPSPRKRRNNVHPPPLHNEQRISRNLFAKAAAREDISGGILKARSSSSAERRRDEQHRKAAFDAKLWDLCGQDIKRWNVGSFDSEPFTMKAARW